MDENIQDVKELIENIIQDNDPEGRDLIYILLCNVDKQHGAEAVHALIDEYDLGKFGINKAEDTKQCT